MIEDKPKRVPPPEPSGKILIPKPNFLMLLTESFGLSRAIAFAVIILSTLVLIGAVYFFVHSAPPSTITITCGPEGSIFSPMRSSIQIF